MGALFIHYSTTFVVCGRVLYYSGRLIQYILHWVLFSIGLLLYDDVYNSCELAPQGRTAEHVAALQVLCALRNNVGGTWRCQSWCA